FTAPSRWGRKTSRTFSTRWWRWIPCCRPEQLLDHTQALVQVSGKLLEMAQAQQAQQGADAGADNAAQKEDDVVDAEFEEVKDKK
ncbi:hypothetical protein ISX56_29055, partial [Serratia ureilytica]|nr:hypothetical protein [Serratia ureilytica]